MREYTKSLELVELVNAKEVVLEEDVRASEGYFRQRYYAGVTGDAVRVCEEPMTLPQALFWKQEEETLYVAENAIRLKEKEVKEETVDEKPRPQKARRRTQKAVKPKAEVDVEKDEA